MRVPLTRIHTKAMAPERISPASSIFRLFACLDAPLSVRRGPAAVMVPTGWALALPDPSVAAMLYPMRQMAYHSGLVFGRGADLLDKTELTEVLISVWNRGPHDEIVIRPGDPIAQLVFMPVLDADFDIQEGCHA